MTLELEVGCTLLPGAYFQLVELSKAQDIEAGDGTTSVVVLAGSLLEAAGKLLAKGLHPTAIAEGFRSAGNKCVEILRKDVSRIYFLDYLSISVERTMKDKLFRRCLFHLT